MSYSIINWTDHVWEERPPIGDAQPRFGADVTSAAELSESRARMWRFPPGSKGRRHAEGEQEEVFVVLAGTLTVLLGEPPERADVEAHGLVAVKPGTAVQLLNAGDVDAVVFAYGAPPVAGAAQILEDIEP